MSWDREMESDVITLVGLGGVGRHGLLPEERRNGQTFTVDVAMSVDTRAAAEQDDLAHSVDYAAVAQDVIAVIEGEPVNLIETLAARIADSVLAREHVQRVEVVVHKPEAPVGVPFADVTVRIARGAQAAVSAVAEPMAQAPAVLAASPVPAAAPQPQPLPMAEPVPVAADLDAESSQPVDVVLALGGNLGDARQTLRSAIDALAASAIIDVVAVAPLAKTAAVLQPDAVPQQDYLNTVVVARTTASPRAVLALAHSVEAAHGRTRDTRWGERTLDIDVISYGTLSSADPELSLPHPRANERAFVLVPWAHVAPDAFLPGLGGGPVAALAETAPDRAGVRWLALDWYSPGGAAAAPAPAAPPAPAEPPAPPAPATPAPAPAPPPVPAESAPVAAFAPPADWHVPPAAAAVDGAATSVRPAEWHAVAAGEAEQLDDAILHEGSQAGGLLTATADRSVPAGTPAWPGYDRQAAGQPVPNTDAAAAEGPTVSQAADSPATVSPVPEPGAVPQPEPEPQPEPQPQPEPEPVPSVSPQPEPAPRLDRFPDPFSDDEQWQPPDTNTPVVRPRWEPLRRDDD